MNQRSAIAKINKNGALLVFPLNNRKEPNSLWAEFFPRKKMKWEWTEDGDDSVADMWSLMKRLSAHRDVVYSKWYQGRATFFSRELFAAMLALRRHVGDEHRPLSLTADRLAEVLEADSPLSTKQLKLLTDLQGRFNEPTYTKGLKELFQRLRVVGFGEVDDGAFPSLAVGLTKLLHEEVWEQSQALSQDEAQAIVDRWLPAGSLFRKHFDKTNPVYGKQDPVSGLQD